MNRLDNKVAVITGGCAGIGLATVELFVAEGAQVVLADIQDGPGGEIAERLGAGRVHYQHCDVREEAQIEAAMAAAAERFGGLDIVFNNAGAGGAQERIEEMTGESWDRTQALLLRSVALGIRYAVPHLRARGGGAIVNTASVAALMAGAAPVAYSAAKAGVLGLTRVAAAELSQYGIRVNAICPGLIMTDIYTTGFSANAAATVRAGLEALSTRAQPLAITATGRHVAEACLYFSSDASAFVTGTHLVVDGGVTVGPRSAWDPKARSPLVDLLERAAGASRSQA